jgi:hypothetical protein
MFGRLLFGLSFGGELAEMLHHGVGIDFADGADFVFHLHLVFVLVLVFFFPEQTADHVAYGAEPAFAFESDFLLELVLHFLFHLVFMLVLVLMFRKGF